MQRTSPGLRADGSAGVGRAGREQPEWRSWLRLLAHAEASLETFRRSTSVKTAGSSPDAPLLHQATVTVDGGRLKRLIRKLAVEAGGSLRGYSPSAREAVQLATAAVRQDRAAVAEHAGTAGADPSALATLAEVAVLPLLHACGAILEERLPRFWPHGHCPVCAAWPMLAERRGLDRSRRLRCGRCGTDWEIRWLCCAYCGEQDHRQLGSLVVEDEGDTARVETCQTCRGYLKSLTTLQRIPHLELLLRDLDTVELDLVALQRDYGRPEVSGFALEVELA